MQRTRPSTAQHDYSQRREREEGVCNSLMYTSVAVRLTCMQLVAMMTTVTGVDDCVCESAACETVKLGLPASRRL